MFQGSSIVGSSNSGQPDSSSGREELLYGARQPESKGKGGVRSAAEIRCAYGRSSTRYGFLSLLILKKEYIPNKICPFGILFCCGFVPV